MSIRNELLSLISIAYGGTGADGTRDEILAEIAVSVGATVRNADNRNMLLEDILAKLTV